MQASLVVEVDLVVALMEMIGYGAAETSASDTPDPALGPYLPDAFQGKQ